jgi:hypothetical protein
MPQPPDPDRVEVLVVDAGAVEADVNFVGSREIKLLEGWLKS